MLADPAKHESPQLSWDMRSPENMQQWVKLFEALDLALLTGNLVADLVDPEKMACYHELKEKLTERDLEDGPAHFLTLHSSTWTNIAIHANQLPSLPLTGTNYLVILVQMKYSLVVLSEDAVLPCHIWE